MKLSRIVVSTSGALRQSRISDAIDAHAAPASIAASSDGDESEARREQRRQRADDELSLAADVPHARAKRDDDAESREQQRHGLEERALQRERAADRAGDEDA